MMMNFGIPSRAARRKAVMKPGTHKGKQEHVMSAKCEHSVKAQQEGTLASTWGRSWKERSRRKQKHNGLFCRPRLNETVKMIHTLLFHTHGQTVLTWRQMCSRGRWKHQAGEGKEPRRGAGVGVGGDSKSSRLEKRQRGVEPVVRIVFALLWMFSYLRVSAMIESRPDSGGCMLR